MRRICSLVLCHKEIYKDQYGEFLCGFWGLGWLAWILAHWASYLSQTTRWDFFEPCPCEKDNASFFLLVFRKLVVIFLLKKSWISCKLTQRLMYFSLCLELVGLTYDLGTHKVTNSQFVANLLLIQLNIFNLKISSYGRCIRCLAFYNRPKHRVGRNKSGWQGSSLWIPISRYS